MTDALPTSLVLDVSRLDPDGETLVGEVDCVDVDEEFVHPFGGVRYRLEANVCGSELLIKGRLEQDFDLVCSRCGADFDTTIHVDDFLQSYEIGEKKSEVDLTEDIRESIILELPAYPLCREDCPGLQSVTERPQDDRWSALDQVNITQQKQQAEQKERKNHGEP